MKQLLILTLIIFSNIVFAQDKTYRFLYDFHQKTILDRAENPNMPADDYAIIVAELNKSYEVEVTANSLNSLVKLVEKINNEQNKSFISIEPEPNWLLNNFETNNSYENSVGAGTYIKDSVKSITLKPTRNSKKILGLDAKEFIAEDALCNYHFWLVKHQNLTVSPVFFQFKGYVVVEAEIINKKPKDSKTISERKVSYILKNMSEEKPFDFEKLIPKKFMTKAEYNALIEQREKEINNRVDKD
ncbi:hypothetical protein HXZ94_11625 [Empedobacter falsenii]|uniref:hypothetical protein n=1 Tax=Empedobacter falsenii TaxID=343874 RepID=UPI002574F18B|nr:hypothetical protein [Empedobacter falsenii]MDM1299141.1 hypothetical protein [Empedobacter falsenii]MDM1318924.1 hypothetical protein [Empedobacter falsenii]